MFRLAGIYFLNNKVMSFGALISKAEDEEYRLIMDGIFFDEQGDEGDAAFALELFKKDGAEALVQKNGHFNITVEYKNEQKIEFISDVLATKPWYFYKKGDIVAASPVPTFFAENSFEMTLNRDALFETVLYNYTINEITLLEEVARNRPFYQYVVTDSTARFVKNYILNIEEEKKYDTTEKMENRIFDIISENLMHIMHHKKIEQRKIQLPLTGGFDSRHILGTLLKNGNDPLLFRHINIQKIDMKPVEIISEDLAIPLVHKSMQELDFHAISREWLQRSGGMMNFHQTYLFDLIFDIPQSQMVGFDGYLMDALLGIRPLFKLSENTVPSQEVMRRYYGSPKVHKALFHDYEELYEKSENRLDATVRTLKGSNLEKEFLLQIFSRSLKYTGSAFSLTGEDIVHFAPGACVDALQFVFSASWKEGMYNKARYSMLEKKFPDMDRYPSIYGKKFSQLYQKNRSSLYKEKMRKLLKTGVLKSFGRLIPPLSFGMFEPVKEGEHYWLRGLPMLRNMMNNFVENSLLVADGYIDHEDLEKVWVDHKKGKSNAWTMMNLFTVECTYRVLVKRESIESVVDILSK